MKKYAFLIIILVILFFLYLALGRNNSSNIEIDNTPAIQQSTNSSILTIGDDSAEVTIIEYFDYKCPKCNDFHRTVGQQINDEFIESGRAKYEIRMTPIIGPDSANAARGAYCANEQAKFTKYHNIVLDFMWNNYYKNKNYSAELENILTTDKLSGLMSPENIDQFSFVNCIDSGKYNPNLDENLILSADDGVRGTPGFKIGNQSFVGGQPYTVFETLINIELN